MRKSNSKEARRAIEAYVLEEVETINERSEYDGKLNPARPVSSAFETIREEMDYQNYAGPASDRPVYGAGLSAKYAAAGHHDHYAAVAPYRVMWLYAAIGNLEAYTGPIYQRLREWLDETHEESTDARHPDHNRPRVSRMRVTRRIATMTHRHYYNGVFRDGSGELLDVICYHSNRDADQPAVYRHWKTEHQPFFTHDGIHMRKLTAREAQRLARQLFGLRPYERYFGQIAFTSRHNVSFSDFAASPEIITHG